MVEGGKVNEEEDFIIGVGDVSLTELGEAEEDSFFLTEEDRVLPSSPTASDPLFRSAEASVETTFAR